MIGTLQTSYLKFYFLPITFKQFYFFPKGELIYFQSRILMNPFAKKVPAVSKFLTDQNSGKLKLTQTRL